MRILQVAPLLTPTNEYGGPTAMALEQCRGLMAAGHEVLLVAAATGYPPGTREVEGVPVRLFPVAFMPGSKKVSSIMSPGVSTWMWRHVQTADVVHAHLARDLVMLPAMTIVRQRRKPYVVQAHGMVLPSAHRLAPLFDAAMTRRVVAGAASVLCLTADELRDMSLLYPGARVAPIENGVTMPPERASVGAGEGPRIVYIARLHPVKQPTEFVKAAAIVAADFPTASFHLYGPDQGEGDEVKRMIRTLDVEGRVTWHGPVSRSEVAAAMSDSVMYVLPSRSEVQPVGVLEALAHGLPVVMTDNCPLGRHIEEAGAGYAVPPRAESLATAMSRLLADQSLREGCSRAARSLAQSSFSMAAVVDDLVCHYETAMEMS